MRLLDMSRICLINTRFSTPNKTQHSHYDSHREIIRRKNIVVLSAKYKSKYTKLIQTILHSIVFVFKNIYFIAVTGNVLKY